MATRDNLNEAFAGESQASRKYLAFANAAEKEGLPRIANLFRAAAEAETVHALAHFRVMGGIKTTLENLQTAVDGEDFEFKQMYPKFIAEADQEGVSPASNSFKNAMAVEQVHFSLYNQALQAAKAGNDLPEGDFHVCAICGNTFFDEVPDKCPVCRAPREKINKVP